MNNRHHNNTLTGWNHHPRRDQHLRFTCPPDIMTPAHAPYVSTTQDAVSSTIMSSTVPSNPSTVVPSNTAASSPQTSSNGSVQPGVQAVNSNVASANVAQNIEFHIDLDSIGATKRARAQNGQQNKQSPSKIKCTRIATTTTTRMLRRKIDQSWFINR